MKALILFIFMILFSIPASTRSEDSGQESVNFKRGDTLEVYDYGNNTVREVEIDRVIERGPYNTELEVYDPQADEYIIIEKHN